MKVSLRVLVAFLGGLAALVVAATVLSVAATIFQDAARQVGTKYISSTVQTARALLEDYFNRPVRDVEMISSAFESMPASAYIALPSDNGDINASSSRICEPFRMAQLQTNVSYESLGLFFDDGSVMAVPAYNKTDNIITPSGVPGGAILGCFMVSSWNGAVTGVGVYSEVNWFSNTLETVPDGTIPLSTAEVDVNNKPKVYATAVSVARKQPIRPFWAPPSAFRAHTFGVPFLTLAISRAIFNSTGDFIGLLALATSMNDLSVFLKSLDRSPRTQLFAMDNSGYIHGTTHSAPVARVYTAKIGETIPSGCLSTGDVSPSPTPGVVCPKAATEFPYAALQQFMSGTGATLKVDPGETYLAFLDVPGNKFQTALAATSVPNEAKTFGMTLLAFVDLEDVEGDLRSGIETAIGITAGIFVLGVALIMIMLYIVLKPLEQVARDMDDTANLRLKDEEEEEVDAAAISPTPSPVDAAAAAAAAAGAGGGRDDVGGTGGGGGGADDGGGMGMPQQSTATDMGLRRDTSNNNYVAQMAKKKTKSGGSNLPALSSISEIASLQTAFMGLSAAIGSFTKYVPRQVIKELIASNKLASLDMEKVPKLTVMFSHVVGFEDMCARVNPDEMARPTALYFDTMYDELCAHSGTIDKFIGDCIMSMWGAPSGTANQEVKASLCALSMTRAASVDGELKRSFDDIGELLTVRCGIASGPAIVGNMGSNTRYSWTALGNTCNLASRTLGTNKRLATRVLVTDSIAHHSAGALLTRALIGVKVVGKQEAVMMHEMVGVRPGLELGNDAALVSESGNGGVLQMREYEADSDAASHISLASAAGGGAAPAAASGGDDAGDIGGADPITVVRQPSLSSLDKNARFVTHTTAAKLLRRAVAHTEGCLVATGSEVNFCERFSAAAEAFNKGDPKSALQMLDDLQRDAPEFFSYDTSALVDLVGMDRCDAGLIRAELSAQVLRSNAQRCVDDPGAEHVFIATGK